MLKQRSICYPQDESIETKEELKQLKLVNVICEEKTAQLSFLSRFSTLRKLRVTAFIQRFKNNCYKKENKIKCELTVAEETEAKKLLIKSYKMWHLKMI